MRLITTFLSVMALLWCAAVLLHLPPREVTWAIPTYVIAQCLFTLVAFLGLQKGSENSPWYIAFFIPTFSAVLLLAMVVAGRLLMPYPFGLAVIVILGSVAVSAATAAVTYYQLLKLYKSHVPVGFAFLCVQAAVLMTCGIVTLLSVLEPSAPSLHAAAIALSLFWLANGVFLFAYMLGFARTVGVKWQNLNLYVPSMLAIVCFGWLAFTLSGLQAEGARAGILSDRVLVEQQ